MGCMFQVLPPLTFPGEPDGWWRGREDTNKAPDSRENQDHDTKISTGNLTKEGSGVGKWVINGSWVINGGIPVIVPWTREPDNLNLEIDSEEQEYGTLCAMDGACVSRLYPRRGTCKTWWMLHPLQPHSRIQLGLLSTNYVAYTYAFQNKKVLSFPLCVPRLPINELAL